MQPSHREWQISCFRQHLETCASSHPDPQSVFEELIYACREYEAHPHVPGEEMQFIWWLARTGISTLDPRTVAHLELEV